MNAIAQEYLNEKINQMEFTKIIKSNETYFYKAYVRTLDLACSILGLLCSLPIIIIVSILIKLEDNGPIIYKQERLGKNKKSFYVYKLRSMKVNAEAKNGAQWAEKNDSRITNIGKFIRKTRIDEIPQLINILVGDMSLIGPRPERPEFTYMFNQEIPGFIDRLQIKPGLTGLAQVNGGYDISPQEKLKWDIKYIENRNIIMDFKIIIKTIKVIFTGEGSR